MSSSSVPFIGLAGGALLGVALGGGPLIAEYMSIGSTLGSIASGFMARPSAVGDAHFPSVTYGTPLSYCWAPKGVALDAALIWAELGSNGSYLQDNGGPGKGKQSGDHYGSTFAVLVKQRGITMPDGTQVERPFVYDRIWMNSYIVYQSPTASPINGWSSSTTYNYGDYATAADGLVYFSLGNGNVNHNPTGAGNPTWWQAAQGTTSNITFTQHPQPNESTFSQAVDSTMAGSLGVANCNAMRGCDYFVCQNMDLFYIGNSLPQMIKIEGHDGAPVWSSTLTYQKGAFAEDGSGNLYVSLQAGNVNNAVTDTAYWSLVPPLTYADIFSDECRAAGLPVSAFDFSAAAVSAPATYAGGTTYSYGSYVTGSDGQYYYSLTADNTGHDPTVAANQGQWWQAGMFPQPLTGMVRNQRMSAQQAVSVAMMLNAWDLAPIDGVLTLVQRGGAAATLPSGYNIAGDLGCTPENSQLKDAIEATLLADQTELHSSFVVSGSLYEEFFRKGGERSNRNSVLTYNPTTIDSGLTLSRLQAAQMAGYLKDTEWLEQGGEFKVYLPGTYKMLAPTDVLLIPYNAQTYRFRITEMSIEENLCVLTMALDQPEILLRNEAGSVPVVSPPNAAGTNIIPVALAAASIPIDFTDALSAYPGFYVFINADDASYTVGSSIQYTPPKFTGCFIEYSLDSGVSWVTGPFVSARSSFGPCTTLGNASASGYETTNDTTVDFTLAPSRETVAFGPVAFENLMDVADSTQAAVNGGAQQALIGSSSTVWEIVGIVNVQTPASNFLSQEMGTGLIRGLRSTPFAGHGSGESFMMAPSLAGLVKIQVPASEIGQTVQVRAVINGVVVSPVVSCVIAQNNPAYVATNPPQAPSSVVASSGIYNGQNESWVFTPEFSTVPTTAQTYNWQVATSSDGITWSSWSASVNLPGSYTPGSITAGYLKVQCQAQNLATPPVQSGWVGSSSLPWTAPATPQPLPVAPDSVSVSPAAYNGSTEMLTFSPVFSASVPTPGQEYQWQYSSDGSTWKGPGGTSASWYSGPSYQGSFSSGNLYVQARSSTNAGVSSWVSVGPEAYVAPSVIPAVTYFGRDAFSASASSAAVTLSNAPLTNSEAVFLDSVLQRPTTDYTLSSTTLTFGFTPTSGQKIDVHYAHT